MEAAAKPPATSTAGAGNASWHEQLRAANAHRAAAAAQPPRRRHDGAGRGAASAAPSTAAVSILHSWYKSEGLPADYIRDGRVFFGAEPDEEQMPHFTELYGEDCLIYASDIPHADRLVNAAELVLTRDDMSDQLKKKYLVDNVARFYGLPVPAESTPAG